MTKDDIIRMARESGFEVDSDDVWITDGFWVEELERFAAIVAAAEREACAKVLMDMAERDNSSNYYLHAALLVRERGAP